MSDRRDWKEWLLTRPHIVEAVQERERQLRLDNERNRLHDERMKEWDSKIAKERAKIEQLNSTTNDEVKTSDDGEAAFKQLGRLNLTESNNVIVVVVGLKSAGKTTIINGLKKQKILTEFEEIGYDSFPNPADLFKKIDSFNAKLHLLVVADTAEPMDAKLAEHLRNSGKKFTIVLTKSDDHVQILKKENTFVSLKNYMEQRRKTALQKIGNVPMFVVSGFGLSEMLEDSNGMEENKFVEFVKQVL